MIWPQSEPRLQHGRLYPSRRRRAVRVCLEQTVGKIMSKSLLLIAPLLAATATAAPAAILGSDAGACLSGKPSMLVHVSGFKQPSGTVKVALYAGAGLSRQRRQAQQGRRPGALDGADGHLHRRASAGRICGRRPPRLNGNGDKDAERRRRLFGQSEAVDHQPSAVVRQDRGPGRARPAPGHGFAAIPSRPVDRSSERVMARTRIALLSNPKSTGNLAQLPRIRAFCAEHPDIFHYEVEKADQVGTALRNDRPGAAQDAGHQRRRRHRPGGADRALQWRPFRRRAAAGRRAAERQDQPHRARSWIAGRSDCRARES